MSTCHFEIFTFAKYHTDLSTNYNINRLEYPEGTDYDFSIEDFREMLGYYNLKFSDKTLQYLKDKLIADKCVSNIYKCELEDNTYEMQIVIILKQF